MHLTIETFYLLSEKFGIPWRRRSGSPINVWSIAEVICDAINALLRFVAFPSIVTILTVGYLREKQYGFM